MRAKALKFVVFFLALISFGRPVGAQGLTQAANNSASLNFPNTATFSATLQGSAPITTVILEYGTQQSTCGEVVAKAFPQFVPGTQVQVEWTWDMRQAGGLPPGASIWWRWRFTDENGKESISEQETVAWLDSEHPWESLDGGILRLHWYGKDHAFAENMLTVGLEGLEFNAQESGLKTDMPIDLYVYPNYDDLQDAILYEPSWTGGMAFPEHNIVILGLSGSDQNWDENTLVHELTHVLVGHLTFSCLTIMPTWLNEGLAVYSEGGLDAGSAAQLQDAIDDDELLSVRSLSAGFSEVPDKAYLSYSQSYSIVNFLINDYGQDKMTGLLSSLKQGVSVDDALMDTYGFNVEGLEAAWRESIGAAPQAVSAQPTSLPTPTYVPTIVPISGAPQGVSTPLVVPTSSFANGEPTDAPGRGSGPPLLLTGTLIATCCVFGLLIGVLILAFVVRGSQKKADNHV